MIINLVNVKDPVQVRAEILRLSKLYPLASKDERSAIEDRVDYLQKQLPF